MSIDEALKSGPDPADTRSMPATDIPTVPADDSPFCTVDPWLCPETDGEHDFSGSDPELGVRPCCGNCGATAPKKERIER